MKKKDTPDSMRVLTEDDFPPERSIFTNAFGMMKMLRWMSNRYQLILILCKDFMEAQKVVHALATNAPSAATNPPWRPQGRAP